MQSVVQRAIKDTISAQKSAPFMWIAQGILAVAGAAWLPAIAPANIAIIEKVGRPVLGGLGGLFVAFLIVFIWNLFKAPYRQRNEIKAELVRIQNEYEKEIDRLQNELDAIQNARPNIELIGKENIQTPIRNVTTGVILGRPVFTQVKFANNPLDSLQAVDATNVAGHIEIYTPDRKLLFKMIGRWSETREEAHGAQPTEMEQITLPANVRPNPMDVVLKYREDQVCFGHTNSSRRLAPNDWRDTEKQLPIGTYLVRIHLRGNNVDKVFWLNLVNKGEGTDIDLQVLDTPP